jgi:hypothetical protein
MFCNNSFPRQHTPLGNGNRNLPRVLLLAFVLIAALLSSCGHDDPEPDNTHAVVFYFPYSDGLEQAVAANIADVKKAIVTQRGLGTTRVMVIMASSAKAGRLSEIVYKNGSCQETQLKSYTEWSFTDRENIRTMFNDAASHANARTYSMVIGAHGSGWLPKESRPNMAKAFGGSTTATKTNIETLDSAIVQSDIKHLEYLCFDDCYMSNIETAYRLRNAVDHLIASTSEIMAKGLPYSDIWTSMNSAQPDYSAIVSGFATFYSTYSLPYGALAVIDCRKTERAAELMSNLNTLLADTGIAPSDITPQVLDGFTPPVYFDMKDYTDRALAALGSPAALTAQFETLYSDLVMAHSSTPYLYSDYTKGTFAVTTNCGVTISDPTVNSQATPWLHSTDFWIATH